MGVDPSQQLCSLIPSGSRTEREQEEQKQKNLWVEIKSV